MENKKRTGLLLSALGVLSLVLITAGVTYAFFNYAKEGETSNTITTGTIEFRYAEGDSAFTLSNATPKDDATGRSNHATSNFQFTVTSRTPTNAKIPYVVTLRADDDNTLSADQVKVYLTASGGPVSGSDTNYANNNSDPQVLYSTLSSSATGDAYAWYNTMKSSVGSTNDKVIYQGTIPADASSNTTATFNLSMWLKYDANAANMADYSAFEFVKKTSATGTSAISVDSFTEGTDWLRSKAYYTGLNADTPTITASEWTRIAYVNYTTKQIYTAEQAADENFTAPTGNGWVQSEQYYPMNNKTFTARVNVYAEGTPVYQ